MSASAFARLLYFDPGGIRKLLDHEGLSLGGKL